MERLSLKELASGRTNNFDLIRFIAASLVIFSHAYQVALGKGNTEPLVLFSGAQIWFGHLALYIFFIISGFLVTQSFERSNNVGVFAWARALRILPAFLASLLFATFIVGPLTTTLPLSAYLSDPLTYDYLKSFFMLKIRWGLPGVFEALPFKGVANGALWTIPQEVSCYALVAFLGCFQLLKRRNSVLILAGIFFYLRIFGPQIPYVKEGRFLDNELRVFIDLAAFYLIGMLFYLYRERIFLIRSLAMFSLVGLFISLLFGGFREVFALCGSYLIFYFAYHPNIKFWNFAKFGDFSYGIYVYAFPVQQLVAWHYHGTISPWKNFVYSFGITLILSIASWHLIEKPALSLKRYFRFSWLGPLHARASKISLPLSAKTTGVLFCAAFVLFITFILDLVTKPMSFDLSKVKNEAFLHGGWHHHSPDETYRWINRKAGVSLAFSDDVKEIFVEGYIPEQFVEVTQVTPSINSIKLTPIALKRGEAINLSIPLPKEAFSAISFEVDLEFNDVHKPAPGAPDQRELSAAITKIGVR